jgi:hypothetical protein
VHSDRTVRTPPLGIAVGSWRLRRSPDRLHALAGEDLVEDAGELGITVADQEPERGDPVAEIHEQVPGLLGGPRAVGVSGHAEDVHAPGLYFHDEQHVEALEKDRVDVEEIARQQAAGLRPEECAPGGVQIARNRAVAARPQDPPHGRRTDVVA